VEYTWRRQTKWHKRTCQMESWTTNATSTDQINIPCSKLQHPQGTPPCTPDQHPRLTPAATEVDFSCLQAGLQENQMWTIVERMNEVADLDGMLAGSRKGIRSGLHEQPDPESQRQHNEATSAYWSNVRTIAESPKPFQPAHTCFTRSTVHRICTHMARGKPAPKQQVEFAHTLLNPHARREDLWAVSNQPTRPNGRHAGSENSTHTPQWETCGQ
jgi:hypothetical protein